VRSKAVELLGARADLRALAAIERALGDSDEQVRRTAVLALRDRTEPAVAQWLARAASTDPSAGVRRVAAEVLGSRAR
jgi:HEAT repeat protein